jgi:hypothetical protein
MDAAGAIHHQLGVVRDAARPDIPQHDLLIEGSFQGVEDFDHPYAKGGPTRGRPAFGFFRWLLTGPNAENRWAARDLDGYGAPLDWRPSARTDAGRATTVSTICAS